MKILNGIFLFYLHLIFIYSQNSLTFQSNYDNCYSITINIDPCNWRVILDTMNSYFILYDNFESSHPWAKRIIKESTNITQGKNHTVKNYINNIKVTEYYSPLKFKIFTHELQQFYYYYTTAQCQDRKVWSTVDPNIRQLSLGLGLNVKQKKYSFVYTLYDNNIINKSVFSFEHSLNERNKKIKYIHFGEVDNKIKNKYSHSFVSSIPFMQNMWGIYISYISIGNKITPVKSFAKINSGIQENIRSFMIYKIFKEFLLEHSQYKDKCKEYNLKNNIITIVCDDIPKDQFNDEITFIVNNKIEFNVPIKTFFTLSGNTCKLSEIYFDSKNKNYELQVGQGFLEMFDLVEFNFEQRDITFFSKDIIFKESKINDDKLQLFILLISIMSMCNLCLLIYIKRKVVN